MKWSLNELTKKKQISFNEELNLRDELLKRSQEILDCQPIEVKGEIAYDDDLFYLDYQIKTVLTLPSSRSLKPVEYPIDLFVNEIFATEESLRGNQELLDNDLIIVLDKDLISLDESITDNLLLEIPLQIFAEDEEAEELPAGKFWSVLSEEDYAKQQEEKLEENKSPFDGLNGLFD
ncbi:DUF177 domain-containing protein [Lactococcus lactis]|uniref:YceD family protein n=1 Tax=Lactococcus lactis TaxID=1358 RepID=UPI0027F5DB93|nr:DUF177 domain-containing protein [Lactococcus lactis]MDQ7189403.1 DUF177 domain-containing protein [Lactococcus lactis]